MRLVYSEENRIGDHIWYISSLEKFKRHYPRWQWTYSVRDILAEIYEANQQRWHK
jgi:CDP-paratose 2-epimerase